MQNCKARLTQPMGLSSPLTFMLLHEERTIRTFALDIVIDAEWSIFLRAN